MAAWLGWCCRALMTNDWTLVSEVITLKVRGKKGTGGLQHGQVVYPHI